MKRSDYEEDSKTLYLCIKKARQNGYKFPASNLEASCDSLVIDMREEVVLFDPDFLKALFLDDWENHALQLIKADGKRFEYLRKIHGL